MKKTNEARLRKLIARCETELSHLSGKELTVHGYWSKGYWESRKAVLEDWLDEVVEEQNGKDRNPASETENSNSSGSGSSCKAVILKTNNGIMLMGAIQSSNGAWFDAEGCYQYCNCENTKAGTLNQVHKLLYSSTKIGSLPKESEDWYRNRENFIDIEIPYQGVIQTWINEID